MFQCKICNKEFETEKALHSHVSRSEKVKLEEYYPKYFPRFDCLTSEPLPFKDRQSYFASFFTDRKNLVCYCRTHGFESSYLLKKVIGRRAIHKQLKFAPSTFEARSSILPTPMLVEKIGIDYNELCYQAGLTKRFDYSLNKLSYQNTEEYLLIDTREQKPIDFTCKTLVTKLDFGDYTSRSHFKNVFIERKSIADFVGTLSSGFERFQKELERAKEQDAYLIVMVEESIDNLLSGSTFPDKCHATPEFIAHRARELSQNFECCQFLFVNDRTEMKNIIQKIFLIKEDVRKIDLQWAYDFRLFK